MSWEWMWLLVVPALGIAVTLVLWILWCPYCREITGIPGESINGEPFTRCKKCGRVW